MSEEESAGAREDDGRESRRTRAVVDRIEGEVAVLYVNEDESLRVDLPASMLPAGASDGDHLVVNVRLDRDARRRTEESIKELQERLEKRSAQQGRKDFKL